MKIYNKISIDLRLCLVDPKADARVTLYHYLPYSKVYALICQYVFGDLPVEN